MAKEVAAEHLEDCFTFEEAKKDAQEWQNNSDRYAFVQDKDTEEVLT